VPTRLPNHENIRGRCGRQVCALGVALFIAIGAAAAQSPGGATPDPLGEWLTAKGYARIRIVNCDNRLWGVVAWEEHAGVDSKNPDPRKRSRPTLGMPVLLGMTQTKQNEWDGDIYNSQDGRTYSANISLLNPNVLKVQGCVLSILCGGENWTRVIQQPGATVPPAATPPARFNAPTARPGTGTHTARPSGTRTHPPTPPPASGAETTPPSDADVCLSIASASGLPHERGLK
jgi:uncharacterized protein (DUF2147 family)